MLLATAFAQHTNDDDSCDATPLPRNKRKLRRFLLLLAQAQRLRYLIQGCVSFASFLALSFSRKRNVGYLHERLAPLRLPPMNSISSATPGVRCDPVGWGHQRFAIQLSKVLTRSHSSL